MTHTTLATSPTAGELRPRTMQFIGVTTGSSFIMRLFPWWAEALGLEGASLEGVDLPLAAPSRSYRAAVERIRTDPAAAGALVTTHKLALLDAAEDMFDELDPLAQTTREVSCIVKRGDRLLGFAMDPITSGLALEDLLGPAFFTAGGDVLCLGAGGAGQAIVLHFLTRSDGDDRPGRIVIVDNDPARLAEVRRLRARLGGSSLKLIGKVTTRPEENDDLLNDLSPRSLIVNATGMGKDREGSPLTAAAPIPPGSVIWDLNYRGELDFLSDARAQAEARGLTVSDGWVYFLRGWSVAIAEVFDLPLSTEVFIRLRAIADGIRERSSG